MNSPQQSKLFLLGPLGYFGIAFVTILLFSLLFYGLIAFEVFTIGKEVHEHGAKEVLEKVWEGPNANEASVTVQESPSTKETTVIINEATATVKEAPTDTDEKTSVLED